MNKRRGCFSSVFGICLMVGIAVFLFRKEPKLMTILIALTAIGCVIGLLVKNAQNKWEIKTGRRRYRTGDVDEMTGVEFERWCGRLLSAIGFRNIRYTKTSGDQGVDIVAVRNGERYAIQCKRYSGSVGNSAVQEVVAGQALYHCTRGLVMTSGYFTNGAIRLAKANGITLWDRSVLDRMCRKAAGQTAQARTNNRPVREGRDEWDNLFDVITVMEDDDEY